MTQFEVDSATAASDLHAFVKVVRARHGRAAARHAALQVGLGCTLPAIALAWVWPAGTWWVLLAVAAAASLAASARRAAARSRSALALLVPSDGEVADDPRTRRQLAELGDELATWLEPHGPEHATMRSWLAQDVRGKLPQLAPATFANLGRPRLGRLLWCLPLALLLLFAWFLIDLLSPPWPGVLGGRTTTSNAGSGGGTGREGDARGGGGGEQRAPPEPAPAIAKAGSAPPPPPDSPEPSPPPPPAEPAPLLDLPTQHRFLVPEFVGDGPTRRVRMHAAEVETGSLGAAAPQETGPGRDQPPPPPSRQDFARAAEEAQRARHVPAAERPMVARFFQALREAAK